MHLLYRHVLWQSRDVHACVLLQIEPRRLLLLLLLLHLLSRPVRDGRSGAQRGLSPLTHLLSRNNKNSVRVERERIRWVCGWGGTLAAAIFSFSRCIAASSFSSSTGGLALLGSITLPATPPTSPPAESVSESSVQTLRAPDCRHGAAEVCTTVALRTASWGCQSTVLSQVTCGAAGS